MAKFPFDLSQFKKTSVDKDYTTLKNNNGHELRIMHSALAPEMREKLKALPISEQQKTEEVSNDQKPHYADGGIPSIDDSVNKSTIPDPVNEVEAIKEDVAATPAPQIDPELSRKRQLYNLIAGQSGATPDQQVDTSGAEKSVFGSNGEAPEKFNPEAWMTAEKQFEKEQADKANLAQTTAKSIGEENIVRQRAGLSPIEGGASQPPTISVPPTPQAAAQPGVAGTTPNADPYGMNAYLDSTMKGVGEKKAGIFGEAEHLGQLGKAQEQVLNTSSHQQEQALNDYQTHVNELNQEYHHTIDDYKNQHIDPNHYLNTQGTAGKVSTAIGLILGGLGSGGGENPALKFLNAQIDRDIQGQKMQLGRSENILSANLRQFGNLKDATEMTRAMQLGFVSERLKQEAARASSPLAKDAALKAAGDLDMQVAPILSQIALRKTLMSGINTNQQNPDQIGQTIQAMRLFNPEMAKSMEERYVPGVGMASVPVPADVRENIVAKNTLGTMAQDLYNWAKVHSGSLSPSDINTGKTKAAELQSMYRNAIKGGVFKKGEQEFIDTLIDSEPTKFFNSIRVLPKLKEIINNNYQQLNILKKGHGLPLPRPIPETPVTIK